MELVGEKKDFDSSNDNNKVNSAQAVLDSSYPPSFAADDTSSNNTSKEVEDLSERVARDLKDGLHPLKVRFFLSLFPSLAYTIFVYAVFLNFDLLDFLFLVDLVRLLL